jgi:GNAT superfamily N-acetyltransferase
LDLDARAIEFGRALGHRALADTLPTLASGQDAAVLAVGGATAVFAWPGAPFNQAIGLGWSGNPPDVDLDAVEAFYRAHGQAAVLDLADQAPPDWRAILWARGYRLKEALYDWTRPLRPEDRRLGDGRVTRAVDARALEAYAAAVARGFLDGEEPTAADLDIARAIARTPDTEIFVAWDEEGAAVAGGALQVRGPIAYLYSAATRPEARRQGLQTALIGARLAFAAQSGARLATIQTEPAGGSRRNAERLGFRVAYTTWNLTAP